jgi:Ca-activated chloride channel homolog
MSRKLIIFCAIMFAASVTGILVWANKTSPKTTILYPNEAPMNINELPANSSQGELTIYDKDGNQSGYCPLKHTDVKAEISGFLVRATVTQEFENTADHKIEAVYTFPLPQNSAVDDMTMLVGGRTVKGKIKRREEAQHIYDNARRNGQVASLLDQERPNIFTQSVTNIMPGEKVKIVISYVETLKYEDGNYEFMFPMVVGPRYIPGNSKNWSPNTTQVPDASRITPQMAKPGTRAGHDISIEVSINAGVPLENVISKTHEVELERSGDNQALIKLRHQNTIPNKDFIIKYDVTGKKIADAVLMHKGENGGFFQLILQPPDRPMIDDITPKELVFVLDTSGSMSGFPIEKAKESMRQALAGLNPRDTFNLITFAGDTEILFPAPVRATPDNLRTARNFLDGRSGGGGTEMMKAIRAALAPTDSQAHLRIVCFMTDGFIGNENEIIAEIKNHPNARVFSFGIGSSVNRFLLDKMAEAGRGEVEYVGLKDDGSAAAKRFHERVQNPLLTNIEVDWGGFDVSDIYPTRVNDLFSAKPLILTGKYSGSGKHTIRIRGRQAGQILTREIAVDFPANEPKNNVLATLWARTKIDALSMQDPNNGERLDLKNSITELGLKYQLMTQYTSFVAVEERILTDGTSPRRVEVPVELPEGMNRKEVSYERDKQDDRNSFSGGLKKRSYGSMPLGAVSETVTIQSESQLADVAKSAIAASPASPKPTPKPKQSEAERNQVPNPSLSTNMHPEILAAINGEGGTFIHKGKADIQIWLLDKNEANVNKLKQLGFEVVSDPSGSKLIIGRIEVSKLSKLSLLTFVRFIAPYRK